MRKLNSKFTTNFVSEEGSFIKNKDYFAFVELDNYACYVVCDGIDEDKELESAKIAVTSIMEQFTERPTMSKFLLKRYIKKANEELLASSKFTRLKVSMTIAVTNYSKVRYALVGNTRFYLFKDGYLKLESKDQSLTQEMADKGMISLDKMAKHKERNNLTSFLGQSDLKDIFVSKKFKLKDGDVFALCTKGIWENCDGKEIEDALEGAKEPKEVVDRVEDLILSRQPKDLENYTLAVTFAEKCYVDPEKKKKIKKIIMIAIPILVAVTILTVTLLVMRKNKLNDIDLMNNYKLSAEKYIVNENYEKANGEYKSAIDIAKKRKLKDDMAILDEDFKFTDMVIEADKDLKDKKYSDALDKYLAALEDSGDVGSISKEYIEKKIEIVKNCINVSDYLVLADKQMENNDLDGAEKTYLEAKRLANNSYLKDERQEIMNKLQEISDKKAQNKADDDKKAEEDKKAKEEEKAKADEGLAKAIDQRKNGDDKYVAGDYVSARMYYTLAQQGFREANEISFVEEMQQKIVLMDKKINETADLRGEADRYLEEANTRLASGDKESAKVLYTLAKEKYTALGLSKEAEDVDSKIKQLG